MCYGPPTMPPTNGEPIPVTDQATDRTRWLALYTLCAGVLMIVLDATIVNVALPSIQEDLGFSQSSLAWVVNAYLIPFGGLLLLAGRFGDLIGQRKVFLGGLAVFTGASLLCAVAQTQEMLIVARFVQGAGGAAASAVVLGMIVTMFPEPREQAKAIGVYGFVASAGGSIGLLTGGALTEAISWHWIFFINVPIGIATAMLALRLVAAKPGLGLAAGADIPGAVLCTVGLMLGVYAIIGVTEHGWVSANTLGLGAISLALVTAFVVRQARIANPLMPLRLFRVRTVTGANLTMALMVAGMFAMFFLGALYLQRVLSYNPLEVGLAFLPSTLMMGIISLRFTERLIMRFGAHNVLLPGIAVDRHRPAAVRAHAGRRDLLGRRVRAHDVHRPRRGRRVPVADAALHDRCRDGGHGHGVGPGQLDRAGRRRHRARRAGDALGQPHRGSRRGRRDGGGRAQRRLPRRLPGRRGARRGRARDGAHAAAAACGRAGRGRAAAASGATPTHESRRSASGACRGRAA